MGQTLSGSADFPVTPGREIARTPIYTLLEGSDQSNHGKPVSIFSFSTESALAQNFFKRLRALRHPGLLNVIHATIMETKKLMYIVTERIEPLSSCLTRLDKESLLLGIYQVARALVFLSKDCHFIHGNVNTDTVFVTSLGDWKLGGFEFCGPAEANSLLQEALRMNSGHSNLQLPPESPAIAPTLDSWLLGVFIWSCYNATASLHFDKNLLKDTSRIPSPLKESYIRLLSANPASRTTLESLIAAPCFSSDPLVQMTAFIESLSIKDAAERDKFYQQIQKDIANGRLPVSLLRRKILPSLCMQVEFNRDLHAVPVVGAIMDQCGNEPGLDHAPVQSMFIKIIQSGDRALRVGLFSLTSAQLQRLVDVIDSVTMSKDIWPAFSGGFIDATPQVRELSVKALVCLAPKLSPEIRNGDMLKYLARLQVDEQHNIRTNATIALGKLCEHLSDETKAKVLLPAFTRALKDPFPPARRAALSAFDASHSFFSAQDCAYRVLPSVAGSTLELDPSIRALALVVLQKCVTTIEKYQASLDIAWNTQMQKPQQPAADKDSLVGWASKWLSHHDPVERSSIGGTAPPVSSTAVETSTGESQPNSLPEDDSDWNSASADWGDDFEPVFKSKSTERRDGW